MASSIVGLTDLARSLIDAGNRLLKPPPSADELLALLNVRLLLFDSFQSKSCLSSFVMLGSTN